MRPVRPPRAARRGRLLAALAPLALTACAPTLQTQLDTLAQAPVCCREVRQFEFRKLAPAETVNVTLSESSPAFVFPSGKSFFAAFELPPYASPYAVALTSLPRPGRNAQGTVLRPRIMLMDESFNLTRTLQDLPFRIGTGSSLVKEFFVNPANNRERYLVVYTDPGAHETQEITTFTPVMVPIGIVQVPIDGRQASHKVANGAVGELTLVLIPYQPAVVGK